MGNWPRLLVAILLKIKFILDIFVEDHLMIISTNFFFNSDVTAFREDF